MSAAADNDADETTTTTAEPTKANVNSKPSDHEDSRPPTTIAAGTIDSEEVSAIIAAVATVTPAPKTSTGRSDRRNQHSRSSGGRSKQAGTTAAASTAEVDDSCLDLDVKRSKKDHKSSPQQDVGLRQQPATFQTFPASSYLQGLTALAHPYAGLFSADPNSVGNGAAAFLTADAHFGYVPVTSAAAGGGSSLEGGKGKETLLGALSQVDSSALRHLITGYREAAALLNRTADELENFLCSRK